MPYIDFHAHHPSLYGERTFQQDVDNYGIHPWNITAENVENLIIEFDNRVNENLLISIGECGLDKICNAPYEQQKQAFLHQILKSEELQLPLVLHCVKAVDDILQIRNEMKAVQPWIFHGFRGKPQQLEQLLAQGFYFSFGFKHNEESLAQCPLDHLFLETDECIDDIRILYEKTAEIKKISVYTLLYNIEQNVRRLFCNFQL